MFKIGLGWVVQINIQEACHVGLGNLALGKKTFVAINGGKKRIIENGSTSVFSNNNHGAMVVQPKVTLSELHYRSIKMMDAYGHFDGQIHDDAAHLAQSCHEQDISQ